MNHDPAITVLIVEDDPQIRAMLEESFNQEGFSVASAADGVAALAALAQRPADVVVTDILMPRKEGLTLIKELRAKDPHVKIIAISGGAAELTPGCNLELATMFGAEAAFAKPLDVDTLIRTIRDLAP